MNPQIHAFERLEALAEIRKLKARYWRGVDTKDAALLRSVFTDDALIDFQGATGGPATDPSAIWHDPDDYVVAAMAVLASITTVHHGFEPEIDLLSDRDAAALWPMVDRAWSSGGDGAGGEAFHGYGFYHDRFRRDGSDWKIASMRLERLRMETP